MNYIEHLNHYIGHEHEWLILVRPIMYGEYQVRGICKKCKIGVVFLNPFTKASIGIYHPYRKIQKASHAETVSCNSVLTIREDIINQFTKRIKHAASHDWVFYVSFSSIMSARCKLCNAEVILGYTDCFVKDCNETIMDLALR